VKYLGSPSPSGWRNDSRSGPPAFGYAYDRAGNRTRKTLADGSEETYGYDGLNRLTAVSYPSGRQVAYVYDAVGNRKSLIDTSKTKVTRWPTSAQASSTYPGTTAAGATGPSDYAGCQAGVGDPHMWTAGFDTWTPSQASYEWLEVTYAKAERAVGVKIHEEVNTPSVMRVDLIEENGTAHTVFSGGDTTPCGAWLTVGMPLTDYAVKKVKVYTRVAGSEGIEAVGLEVPGGETYAYNDFNQLLSVAPLDGSAATSFGYDGNGNQTSKTDASGLAQYVYNQDNRLVGIALPGGVSNAFEYDANGLRTKKTDSSGTTRYLLDGLSVIAQYAPSGERQAWYTQSLARIDEVLNVANDSGKLWYQADALGSVYGLTNQAGALIGSQNYDVFGAPMPAPSGPAGQPFGFTGREHELDSGLVYARARYLNPAVGRWDRADPLGLRPSVNLYAYVDSSPIRTKDPLGLYPWWMHDWIIESAIPGVRAEYKQILFEAQYDADFGHGMQSASLAYRHAMRCNGQDPGAALGMWWNFIVKQLLRGVALARSRAPGPVTPENARDSLREVGFGMHAVQDLFSPSHTGFQLWRDVEDAGTLGAAAVHIGGELNPLSASPDIQEAIGYTQQYYRAFLGLMRWPTLDEGAVIAVMGNDLWFRAWDSIISN
jgi:RHS repeat-associated protein